MGQVGQKVIGGGRVHSPFQILKNGELELLNSVETPFLKHFLGKLMDGNGVDVLDFGVCEQERHP